MKLAPLHRALLERDELEHLIVHTGQHYDRDMSDTFFEDLGIPEPHVNLEVGSGTHAQQTAAIMQRFEGVCENHRPDLVLVYGDVNSTVAASLVAAKMGIKVGHVEAGLRSRDWTMPEEINRVVTDRLADLLFTPSRDADENLRAEGVSEERIKFVGNIMIDTLVYGLPRARELAAFRQFNLESDNYVVVTLHRPSNVDNAATLQELMNGLGRVGQMLPVLFPVHPRTRARMKEFGTVLPSADAVQLTEPIGYLEMLSLVDRAGLVVTDSGGLQEETTYLGVPCLTARSNTERPITVTEGTNRLVASRAEEILAAANGVLEAGRTNPKQLERWDGKTGERIAHILSSGR
jgi:UDP-N-acetylglucosamine 2-epimerase (non-hydrolysing)